MMVGVHQYDETGFFRQARIARFGGDRDEIVECFALRARGEFQELAA